MKGVFMNWTELLTSEIEAVYKAAQGLLDLLKLQGKPVNTSHLLGM